ncbi:MAG TPA: DUF3987 domain-containing protein [Acidimicrobiales bacterium]|nr:DUF3987 domain-containing protein [Acidimicrobiales bacterium]
MSDGDDGLDPILRGPLGQLVMMTYGRTEADPVAVTVQLATLLAASLGPARRVQCASPEPIRLYTLVVGKSGVGRKGTSWKVASRLAQLADPSIEGRIQSGFGSGESIVDSFATENGDRPDPRLCIFADEFARILKTSGRQGDTTSELLREAWNSDRLQARARQKTTVAEVAHICIVGHVTPTDLSRWLSPEKLKDGFIGRMLFVWSVGGPHVPFGSPDWLTAEIATEASKLGDFLRRNRTPGTLHPVDGIEGEVLRWWQEEARPPWAERVESADEPMETLGSRWESYCWRLAGLAAVLEDSDIERHHLEWGLAVWEHSWNAAMSLFGPAGMAQPEWESPTNRDRMRVRQLVDTLWPHVEEAGIEGLTAREVNRLIRGRLGTSAMAEVRTEGVKLGLWFDQTREPANGVGRPQRVLVARDQ